MKRESLLSVVMIAYPGADLLDVAGPLEVFAAANEVLREKGQDPRYRVLVLAEEEGVCRTGMGVGIAVHGSWVRWRNSIDTLMVAGGLDYRPLLANAKLAAWLRSQAKDARRVASVCTGAFALAEAGLLRGKRAATHWMATADLAARYPDIRVEPDAIYTRDGKVSTSAGVSAGMDLALALVEEDLGRRVALTAARYLVLYLKRPGGQSQYSRQLRAQAAGDSRLASLLAWMSEHFRQPLRVEDLAERAAMSPRTFARVFAAETGSTPARYLETLRLEEALRLLEEGSLAMEEVAGQSGFASAEQQRRAFLRVFGLTPLAYRQRFSSARRLDVEE